jgi:hypothetical protein
MSRYKEAGKWKERLEARVGIELVAAIENT